MKVPSLVLFWHFCFGAGGEGCHCHCWSRGSIVVLVGAVSVHSSSTGNPLDSGPNLPRRAILMLASTRCCPRRIVIAGVMLSLPCRVPFLYLSYPSHQPLLYPLLCCHWPCSCNISVFVVPSLSAIVAPVVVLPLSLQLLHFCIRCTLPIGHCCTRCCVAIGIAVVLLYPLVGSADECWFGKKIYYFGSCCARIAGLLVGSCNRSYG